MRVYFSVIRFAVLKNSQRKRPLKYVFLCMHADNCFNNYDHNQNNNNNDSRTKYLKGRQSMDGHFACCLWFGLMCEWIEFQCSPVESSLLNKFKFSTQSLLKCLHRSVVANWSYVMQKCSLYLTAHFSNQRRIRSTEWFTHTLSCTTISSFVLLVVCSFYFCVRWVFGWEWVSKCK